MKKTIIILSLLFLISANIKSQEVVLEENVLKDSIKSNYGRNLKHFAHFYLGYGFVIGETNNNKGEVLQGKNNNFEFGLRYKYKISNFYSLGSGVSYNIYSYSIKQSTENIMPDRLLHNTETLRAYTLSLNVYNRFNYGRRGNFIGKFVDIGIYGDWCFTNRHLYKDKLGSGITSRTAVSGLRFYEPFYYGVYGNIGFNRVVLTCKYRMTDIFKPKYDYPQMPPLTIGLQLGIH